MATVDYKRELKDLLQVVMDQAGSDIHFAVGAHPLIRVAGSLVPLVNKPILTDQDVEGFAKVLITKERFEMLVQIPRVLSLPAENGRDFFGLFVEFCLGACLRGFDRKRLFFARFAFRYSRRKSTFFPGTRSRKEPVWLW